MRLSELERETAPRRARHGRRGRSAAQRKRRRGRQRQRDRERQHRSAPPAGRTARRQRARPSSRSSCAPGCRRASAAMAERVRRSCRRSQRARAERLPAGPARVSGARKAAVLMAALGSERAANVIQRLARGRDREPLARDGATRAPSARRRPTSIFNELAAASRRGHRRGRRSRLRARGDRARARPRARRRDPRAPIAGTESRPFEFLRRVAARADRRAAARRVPADDRAGARQPARRRSRPACSSRLPEAEQPDIALRIARMGDASAQVIEQVEDGDPPQDWARRPSRSTPPPAAPRRSRASSTTPIARLERNVLDNLASSDKELAEEVRGMLFVFEDIVKLEERAIQQVLREVDQKDLVLALRGARGASWRSVLTNMSERGAAMLKEEMEIQPPQRKRDVDDAQSRVVGGRAPPRGSRHDRDRRRRARGRGGRSALSEAAVSYDFEQLEPSEPPPRDAPARALAAGRSRRPSRSAQQARAEGHAAGRADGLAEGVRGARRRSALGEALAGVEALRDRDRRGGRARRRRARARRSPARSSPARCRRVPSSSSKSSRARCAASATDAASPCSSTPPTCETRPRRASATCRPASPASSCATCSPTSASRRGGAIVRTAEGEVDAGVQTQLERAREVRRCARSWRPTSTSDAGPA